jgi:putative hydrolase of the HAD superfamily
VLVRGLLTHVHRRHRGTRRNGAGALRALLLDLGGTVFRSGNEMLGRLGEAEPAVRAVAARRGPLGPEPDALWDRMIASEITEREYWQHRCDEVGAALGRRCPLPTSGTFVG